MDFLSCCQTDWHFVVFRHKLPIYATFDETLSHTVIPIWVILVQCSAENSGCRMLLRLGLVKN